MRFLYLDTLKIDKDFNFKTKSTEIEFVAGVDTTLAAIRFLCSEAVAQIISNEKLETWYDIYINAVKDADDEVNEDFFTTVINTFLSTFFNAICIDESRKREHRLDVPEKFKEHVRVSLGLLKKVINTKTLVDNFNITIHWQDYTFELVNQDFENEESNTLETEFKHAAEEAPDHE